MLESQKEILTSQEGAREKLAHNLEQLTHEKQLINNGQEQLTNMTRNIHQQLGKGKQLLIPLYVHATSVDTAAAADLLGDQEESMRKGHQQIQEDIFKVKENIEHVWERVGELLTLLYLIG